MAGKTPFVIYQGAWSVLQRDLEREVIPIVRAEGMALAPWNVLARGRVRSDEEEERRIREGFIVDEDEDEEGDDEEEERRKRRKRRKKSHRRGMLSVQALVVMVMTQICI